MSDKKKTLVISGINMVDGGILSIYYQCIDNLSTSKYYDKYNIYLLVGKKELFGKYKDKFNIIEFPDSKKSWFKRIYYEYFYFKKLSKELGADIWISLHDMSANVEAKKRYVYCHNSTPFYQMRWDEIKYDWKVYAFSKFYKYLYKINIKKDTGVIVQQDWIRKEFKKMYHINNVIVAKPTLPKNKELKKKDVRDNTFIYPSYPRFFKNFQVVCEATKILNDKGINNFKVIITLDANQNRYSKEIVEKYKDVKSIEFVGLLQQDKLFEEYDRSKCLIFTSKLETWGLPISEFKSTGRAIIASDLPYAHETVGTYDKVAFVNPNDSNKLAELMKQVIDDTYNDFKSVKEEDIKKPYCENWEQLFQLILEDNESTK